MKAATEVRRCLLNRVSAGSAAPLPLPRGIALGGRRGEICAVGAGGAGGRGRAAPVLLFSELDVCGGTPLEHRGSKGGEEEEEEEEEEDEVEERGEGESEPFASLDRVCALDWADTGDGERTSLVVAAGAGGRPLMVWAVRE